VGGEGRGSHDTTRGWLTADFFLYAYVRVYNNNGTQTEEYEEEEEEEPSTIAIPRSQQQQQQQQPPPTTSGGRPPRAPPAKEQASQASSYHPHPHQPMPTRRARPDALYRFPFVDTTGHVEGLLCGGQGEAAGPGFYALAPREQERRARKVNKYINMYVGRVVKLKL
jgi:hypothetical protein